MQLGMRVRLLEPSKKLKKECMQANLKLREKILERVGGEIFFFWGVGGILFLVVPGGRETPQWTVKS